MTTRSDKPRCERCAFRARPCLCPDVPHVTARTEIIVVRHAAELLKQSGSARWAALALGASCRIIDYAATPEPFDGSLLPLDGAWLLYPGGEEGVPSPLPQRLIIPDGTWQQARRMVARIPELRSLPRLALPAPGPGPRLRKSKDASGMCTLEAIAGALQLCGEPGPAAQLQALYETVMRRTKAYAFRT